MYQHVKVEFFLSREYILEEIFKYEYNIYVII